MTKVNLKYYSKDGYNIGASKFKWMLWLIVESTFFRPFFIPISIKRFILRIFGAKIGKEVVIKPNVKIKFPWRLRVGDYSWIGENVWIDNLSCVDIGNHVCISQGAMLLCGNHNYTSKNFDLTTKAIILHDGVWITAKSVVCSGVIAYKNSILLVNSVATSNLKSNGIYRGNPASFFKHRKIDE